MDIYTSQAAGEIDISEQHYVDITEKHSVLEVDIFRDVLNAQLVRGNVLDTWKLRYFYLLFLSSSDGFSLDITLA